jgi:hypothetical protein
MTISLENTLASTAETDRVDFKREFNPGVEGEWCEILKDILAMGNSGGGRSLLE